MSKGINYFFRERLLYLINLLQEDTPFGRGNQLENLLKPLQAGKIWLKTAAFARQYAGYAAGGILEEKDMTNPANGANI